MKEIIFVIYLIGLPICFFFTRKYLKKSKRWTGQALMYTLLITILWPIVLFYWGFYELVNLDFWNDDLPKWF